MERITETRDTGPRAGDRRDLRIGVVSLTLVGIAVVAAWIWQVEPPPAPPPAKIRTADTQTPGATRTPVHNEIADTRSNAALAAASLPALDIESLRRSAKKTCEVDAGFSATVDVEATDSTVTVKVIQVIDSVTKQDFAKLPRKQDYFRSDLEEDLRPLIGARRLIVTFP